VADMALVSALGTSAVLEAALEYARAGLHVFPLSWGRTPIALCPACQPDRGCPGKDRCLCGVGTCHGFWAATTDEAKIRRWYTQHPDWQVAIRTGAASNLVVLDVDLDKGGLDTLVGLERAGLDKAGTGCQLTGSGLSFHLLYRHPGGVVPSTQGSWPSGLGPGLDVRGDGGYIVAAPSRHPATGARYEMLGELGDPPVWCPPRSDTPFGDGHSCAHPRPAVEPTDRAWPPWTSSSRRARVLARSPWTARTRRPAAAYRRRTCEGRREGWDGGQDFGDFGRLRWVRR